MAAMSWGKSRSVNLRFMVGRSPAVIVKGDLEQVAVCRTTTMPADNSNGMSGMQF